MTTNPYAADEKTTLLGALQSHRDVMLWKLDGLSHNEIRRAMVPSGTSLLGLVKHLATTSPADTGARRPGAVRIAWRRPHASSP